MINWFLLVIILTDLKIISHGKLLIKDVTALETLLHSKGKLKYAALELFNTILITKEVKDPSKRLQLTHAFR